MKEKNEDSSKDSSKLNNGMEILQHIKDIKAVYEAKSDEIIRESEMSFLDKFNRLIQLILNDNSFTIYTALEEKSVRQWRKRRIFKWIKDNTVGNYKNIFYFIFLTSITVFLVSEAVIFYADGNLIDFKTYTKAILTELSFIFLSGYKTSSLGQKVWVSVLRTGIFSLMLFVISSQTIMTGTQFQTNSTSIQEQAQILERQIVEKEKTIQFYIDRSWGNNVRKHTDDKNKLVERLIELKEKQAQGHNEKISNLIIYKSYGQAFFRVLLLFISVLITRRLFVF